MGLPIFRSRTRAHTMKTPCPECAASSVWVGVAKVTRERWYPLDALAVRRVCA